MMYQQHADNSIPRIKVQTVTMSFRPSGEILIVPVNQEERFLAIARNDRLF